MSGLQPRLFGRLFGYTKVPESLAMYLQILLHPDLVRTTIVRQSLVAYSDFPSECANKPFQVADHMLSTAVTYINMGALHFISSHLVWEFKATHF
jgi:hypothetical protein